MSMFKVTELKDYGAMGGRIEAIVNAADSEEACRFAARYFNGLFADEFDADDFEYETLGDSKGVLDYRIIEEGQRE